MNTKNLGILALSVVLVMGVVFLSGCIGGGPSQEGSTGAVGEEQEQESQEAEPVEESSEKDWCRVGTLGTVRIDEGIYKGETAKSTRTGIEKHTINGKSKNLCCTEMEINGKVMLKTCSGIKGDYDYIMWSYDEEKGKLVKSIEKYETKDHKICVKTYDSEGNIIREDGKCG